jgi:ORF6N domain
MAKKELQVLAVEHKILNRIYIIRGQKVMLDEDLSVMYRVETKRLNEQVKRNKNRFPKDFMFTLTQKEYTNLKSQIATSSVTGKNVGWGGRRKYPYAFTEQGVAMLSSVLNSDVAIDVNIRIIRVFTKMREYALTHKDILLQLAKLEKQAKANSSDIENIFLVLKELIEKQAKPVVPKNRIGFKQYD